MNRTTLTVIGGVEFVAVHALPAISGVSLPSVTDVAHAAVTTVPGGLYALMLASSLAFIAAGGVGGFGPAGWRVLAGIGYVSHAVALVGFGVLIDGGEYGGAISLVGFVVGGVLLVAMGIDVTFDSRVIVTIDADT